MTKNRLRCSKRQDLSLHAHKARYGEGFTPEAAIKIAKNIKRAIGEGTYQFSANHDPVLTRALKDQGIRFRTPEEEQAWENATPEQRMAVQVKHQERIQKMIGSGKCTELFAPANRPFHAPGKSQYVFFEDITLSL